MHPPAFLHSTILARINRRKTPLKNPLRPVVATASTPASSADEAPPAQAAPAYKLAPGEVGVRFINTPSGVDVVAAASPGDALLRVGDGVGVQIPRACQSGLCGTCTCDIIDASAEGGMETVRACQTGVAAPNGSTEMVVDVARMKEARSGRFRDPMARFENLDTEYVAGAAPRKRGKALREGPCETCGAKGSILCDACGGIGTDEGFDCLLCMGTGNVHCGDCQGTGTR